jgi:hypothetical protein
MFVYPVCSSSNASYVTIGSYQSCTNEVSREVSDLLSGERMGSCLHYSFFDWPATKVSLLSTNGYKATSFHFRFPPASSLPATILFNQKACSAFKAPHKSSSTSTLLSTFNKVLQWPGAVDVTMASVSAPRRLHAPAASSLLSSAVRLLVT